MNRHRKTNDFLIFLGIIGVTILFSEIRILAANEVERVFARTSSKSGAYVLDRGPQRIRTLEERAGLPHPETAYDAKVQKQDSHARASSGR